MMRILDLGPNDIFWIPGEGSTFWRVVSLSEETAEIRAYENPPNRTIGIDTDVTRTPDQVVRTLWFENGDVTRPVHGMISGLTLAQGSVQAAVSSSLVFVPVRQPNGRLAFCLMPPAMQEEFLAFLHIKHSAVASEYGDLP